MALTCGTESAWGTKVKAWVHELHDPSHSKYVHASKWCVTRKNLQDFERAIRNEIKNSEFPGYDFPFAGKKGPTIHIVTKHYIKPMTLAAGGMSWALWCNPAGLKCDLFASHCWDEGIFEFIANALLAWPRDAKHLWACFLANPQNGDIGAMIGDDIAESPFAKALNVAKYLVILPNESVSVYARLWCVYEAHLGLKKVGERSIQIKLPAVPNNWLVLLPPGLLLSIGGALIGFYELGPEIGTVFGPVMWVLVCFSFCSVVSFILGLLALNKCSKKVAIRTMMVFEYCELLIVGTGAGVAFWHLYSFEKAARHLALSEAWLGAHHFGVFFEEGEYVPCSFVIVSLTLVYVAKLFEILKRDILRRAEQNLDFETVAHAQCTNSTDEQRIRAAIKGDEDAIDEAIFMLQAVGRYDSDVKANIDKGVSYEHARDGIVPFKVVAACCCFAFWWVTDLVGRGYTAYGYGLIAGVCAFGLTVAYSVGERAVFAINAAMWTGVIFVVLSNHFWFFTEEAVMSLNMAVSSIPLWLVCFFVMLVCDIAHYCGLCIKIHHYLPRCLFQTRPGGIYGQSDRARTAQTYSLINA